MYSLGWNVSSTVSKFWKVFKIDTFEKLNCLWFLRLKSFNLIFSTSFARSDRFLRLMSMKSLRSTSDWFNVVSSFSTRKSLRNNTMIETKQNINDTAKTLSCNISIFETNVFEYRFVRYRHPFVCKAIIIFNSIAAFPEGGSVISHHNESGMFHCVLTVHLFNIHFFLINNCRKSKYGITHCISQSL